MKKYLSTGLALSVILALANCGGGGDSTSTTIPTNAITSGTASDGYLSGSNVCFDVNINGVCDNGEPATITDINGSYRLEIPQTVLESAPNAPLLVTGGIDIDSKSPLIGSLRAPFATNTNITPLSTMAHSLIKDKNISVDEAYQQVADALGLTFEEVQSDPVKLALENNNTKVIAASMALNNIVTSLAEVAKTTGETSDAGTLADSIYNSLSNAIESAAASNDTNKSVANIFIIATEDTNSTLPHSVKEAAKLAPTIETQVNTALNTHESLSDAAVVTGTAITVIQTQVVTALDNNVTIDDTFIQNVEANATTTAENADPVKSAIENLFTSYGIALSDTDAQLIKSEAGFTKSEDVTIEAIIKATYTTPALISVVNSLKTINTYEEIKVYLTDLGYPESTWTSSDLNEKIAHIIPDFTPDMSKENFSALLYATGDAELMNIALQISPPENYATTSDVQKAKDLLRSLRTQTNSVTNANLTGFADTESVKIDEALNNTALNVEVITEYMNGYINTISTAIDNNQTSVTTQISDNRSVAVVQSTSSGNISWTYNITQYNNDNTETHWIGNITYPDENYENFDPSSFAPLHVTLTGDLPLDFQAITKEGIEDKQSVNVDLITTKTSTGADFVLSASIQSNGDSLAISDAKASIAYTTDAITKEPLPAYIELSNLYVDGTVGDYTLNGKIDVNSYVQNRIMAAAGGAEIETTYSWFAAQLVCDGDVTSAYSDNSNITFTFNGKEYSRTNWTMSGSYYNYDLNRTEIPFGFDEIEGELTISDEMNLNNYSNLHLEDCENASITVSEQYSGYWTNTEPNNSGYLPSDISFNGKLTNTNDNSYFEGLLNAKWIDATDANLNSEEYTPKLQLDLSGSLQMPASPLMSVTIAYDNTNGNIIDTTYAYGDLSVTTHDTFDETLENGTINITASTGIKSSIVVVAGDIDYANSTLTTTDGKILGTYEDRSGVPTVVYIDGTFESLP